MRIFARDIKARSYTADLMNAMTQAMGARWKRLSANWTATGSEAVVLDTEHQMEYHITVTPVRRPENVTLQ